MWEPVGPLPASVYWRRRWVAVASLLTVVTLLVWGAAALLGPPEQPGGTTVVAGRAAATAPATADGDRTASDPTSAAADPAPGTATEPARPDPEDPTRERAPGAGEPGPAAPDPAAPGTGVTGTGTTGTTGTGATGTPAGEPTETLAATSEQLRPDDTLRAPVPVPEPEPVPQTGPVPCTNDMLTVTAEIDAPEHRVGQRPTLRLVVVNRTGQPCVRDLDSQRQEIVVWSADLGTRLWSSNDCVNAPSTDLRTLVPGRPVAFSVRWAGRTSEPGCPVQRTTVPAGDYQVMTRIDDLISAPTPFSRLP